MKTLLVASSGGHLEQLRLLEPRLTGLDDDRVWVTPDTPQSRSLLEGEQRIFIPWCGPRDRKGAVSSTRMAFHILGLADWANVVSTGSLPAVPFLSMARARGMNCHYIESAARVDGPSLSGKILSKVPGVHCYSQYRWSGHPSWQHRGSVLDSFVATPSTRTQIERVVVTLGTNKYGFRRLVESLLAILPAGADVLWQTGVTDVSGLPIEARRMVPEEELHHAMAKADLVVAHAGVGASLTALRAGRCPVLVPRRRQHGEHVDDHQDQIALELARRGLAIAAEADELTPGLLEEAAQRRACVDGAAPSFFLEGAPEDEVVLPASLRGEAA